MGFGRISTVALVDSYAEYLRIAYPQHSQRFDRARPLDQEAAMAEAVTFHILESLALSPKVHESLKTGGPDFMCTGSFASPVLRRFVAPPQSSSFFVEATSLLPDAVTTRSGIPNEIPECGEGGAFSLLTQSVNNKAEAKNAQLEGCGKPGVVAIASTHTGIAALFNAATAEYCLVSEPQVRTPLGGGPSRQETTLQRSVFLELSADASTVISKRRNISAILLIAVYGTESEVFGILHPEPHFQLDVKFFPKVPFIRLRNWPIVDRVISTEWVISDPDGWKNPHWPIKTPPSG
jgi:hypothetical protein